jgi:hypothetical protein
MESSEGKGYQNEEMKIVEGVHADIEIMEDHGIFGSE